MIPLHLIPEFEFYDDKVAFVDDCLLKINACIAEYEHEDFGRRKHGSEATYMDGCRGPLCMAAHRIKARERTGAQASEYWARCEPVLVWFGTILEQRAAALRRLEAENWAKMLEAGRAEVAAAERLPLYTSP